VEFVAEYSHSRGKAILCRLQTGVRSVGRLKGDLYFLTTYSFINKKF
jgi:hypothetical protein